MSTVVHRRPLAERWPRPDGFGLGHPAAFYAWAGRLLPWCWAAAALFGLLGLAIGLLCAPTDTWPNDACRILFIHLPATWMSILIYLAMAGWASLGLLLNARLPSWMATALAPTGALTTFIALWTGALWVKPTWGAWWVWDARLTLEFLLLFLYLSFMTLQAACDDPRRGERVGAILLLLGALNLPLIYALLMWLDAAQPDPSTALAQAPDLASVGWAGLLLMAGAFGAWAIAAALVRVRSLILERGRGSHWVGRLDEAR